MNKQEIFDTVVEHLRKQGKRAISDALYGPFPGQGCAYRAPDGSKCAAGCLLTDAEYDPSMEGKVIDAVCPERLVHQLSFIRQLQMIHDFTDVDAWEKDLSQLAEKYELTYTPVQS